MVSERNRVLELIKYIEAKGIVVNIGKNKARGNKGVFKFTNGGTYRIDISQNIDSAEILSVLLHEYAHYVHYCYDSSLESLEFVFDNFDDELREELIKVTVNEIPQKVAEGLYRKKQKINNEIKDLVSIIKESFPDFKQSQSFRPIEKNIKMPLKFLLQYDRVCFVNTIYSVDEIDSVFTYLTPPQSSYIKLKSKQRALRRINAKINRLNKYYNKTTELFARFVEQYFNINTHLRQIAPRACEEFDMALKQNKVPEFRALAEVLKTIV